MGLEFIINERHCFDVSVLLIIPTQIKSKTMIFMLLSWQIIIITSTSISLSVLFWLKSPIRQFIIYCLFKPTFCLFVHLLHSIVSSTALLIEF